MSSSVVVLGSGSRYRRALLARVLEDFEVVIPNADESRRAGETGEEMARRLARLKAEAVAVARPDAIVIGSDQVAECDGEILGKPGSAERARVQLGHCAGRTLVLSTAVCVLAPGDGASASHLDLTRLKLRPLSSAEIARYVARDQPLDCAGSFRFEALGAALFTEIDTRDPTAIEGLPLLWLTGALRSFGLKIP